MKRVRRWVGQVPSNRPRLQSTNPYENFPRASRHDVLNFSLSGGCLYNGRGDWPCSTTASISSTTGDTLPVLHKLLNAAEIVKHSKGLSRSEKTAMSSYGAVHGSLRGFRFDEPKLPKRMAAKLFRAVSISLRLPRNPK